MAKLIIPEGLKGKELFKFLMANKSTLIAQKKAMPIKYSEPFSSSPSLFHVKGDSIVKAALDEVPTDADTFRVKVVANAAYWCDSHYDVTIPDCWKKSIAERKGMLPHLHDHEHKIGAELGDVFAVYSQDIPLSELGINKAGTTQCLIWETDIKKAYNEMAFNKYKSKRIKQHSIALQYVRIGLGINDKEYAAEYDFYNKYIDKIINREYVDELGFFWGLEEIKVFENSAVLFGANELTPTLEIEDKSDTGGAPSKDTHNQPAKSAINFGALVQYK